LFFVNTGFDVNHYWLVTLNMVHRLLHGLEITRAISRHNNLAISHKKAQKAQKNC
jgi:hypothetical protein